ncbi:MAG TPA: ROK family protein [Fimbriimonadaceae bacterium]|nr:ROK family protein [Fimbriimonadaceae bacterium]
MGPLWGIDLGETKTEGAVFDGGSTLARIRVPTRAEDGYEQVLRSCAEVVERLEAETGLSRPTRIGFGTPGSCDPATGLMRNCNTVCLNGRALPSDLSQEVGSDAVVANDANCFALAEAHLGSGRGHRCVFGVILGTGVGGGLVLDGGAWAGANGIAGEWGHITADAEGEPCYCGRRGCVETVLSGPALEGYYHRLSGETLGLEDIVAAARTGGNKHAASTVERLCSEFGRLLAYVVNILDPDVVVLGGGVGLTDELYDMGTIALRKHVFHDGPRLRVVRPLLGDSAGVYGAGLLARTDGENRP